MTVAARGEGRSIGCWDTTMSVLPSDWTAYVHALSDLVPTIPSQRSQEAITWTPGPHSTTLTPGTVSNSISQ